MNGGFSATNGDVQDLHMVFGSGAEFLR